MQTTVILLKPDCYQKKLAGEILRRFESAGLRIRACKMLRLSTEILKDHYSHLAEKPFFPEIVKFMQAAPVIALALEGEECIAKVRDMLGPTDSKAAPKGTIRGDLGEDKMRNLVHASDSPETAAVELKRFFRQEELF